MEGNKLVKNGEYDDIMDKISNGETDVKGGSLN